MNKKSPLIRLTVIRNHLSSNSNNPLLSYKSNKNKFDKWRKDSNFDKSIIENLYFPYARDLRDFAFKILTTNPEFK
jgi:hypothetical protein